MQINDFAVGTDIEPIQRFRKFKKGKDKKFLMNTFSNKELDYCFSKQNCASHLAARFTGKEAVIKVLNSFGKSVVKYSDIEILNNKDGAPFVKLNHDGYKNLKIKISISHSEDYAIAFAMALVK